MYRHRLVSARLRALVHTFPAVVVAGARQVGKSTLVQHLFGDRGDMVVFDPVVDVGNARRDPDLFLDNHRTPLILDEIQYAPELVPSIKRRIDRDRRPGQFVMTGSQQWHVLSAIAESLAGRVAFLDLEAFCLAEIAGSARSWLAAWLEDPAGLLAAHPPRLPLTGTLYERLWRGWLPEACQLGLEMIPDFHAAYQRTYIERDVRLLADVADWHVFSRFVQLAAALTAQEVNHSQFGREIGVTPSTAARWLSLLQATCQWTSVPAYTRNAVKRLSGRPKGYLADTGLACHVQALSAPKTIAGHPLLGPLFETAVVAEVRKHSALLATGPHLHHWRAAGGAEVDLMLERDGVFYPIEVKASSNPNRRDTSGISAFRKTHPELRIAKGLVIAPVDDIRQLSEEDYAIPWDLDGPA